MDESKSIVQSKTKLFFQTFSIRGVSKIHHAKSKFEKILWIAFVIVMTFTLIVTMLFLIQNYLQYITSWHTSSKIDDNSEFPGITLCAQNPFSRKANQIWMNNEILSPTELQDNLTLISLHALDKPDIFMLSEMRLYDLFSTFYMNLDPNDSIRVGHSRDIIKYCIITKKEYIEVAENCQDQDGKLKIKLFSSYDYFNCYTIEGESEFTKDITELSFVLDLVPSDDIYELSKTFLIDMLNRGEGMKIVIHEPNGFPDIEKLGFNLHPSKMNSIVYSKINWHRLRTPKLLCDDLHTNIFDLGRSFNYTEKQCIDMKIQKEVMEKCKCMLSNKPRPFAPNSSIPYCLRLESIERSASLIERFNCFMNIQEDIAENPVKYDIAACSLRCQHTTYETTMSITKWKASEKKLYHLKKLTRSYLNLRQKKSKENVQKVAQILKSSLEDSEKFRQSFISKKHLSLNTDLRPENDLTYVTVTRKNFEVTIKTEKLVMDSNTLLSRMGGLSSLCIGLTAAFVAEMIEFIYIICNCDKRKSQKNHKNQERKNYMNYECKGDTNPVVD